MSEELHEHYAFIVDKGQAPLRIDKFLINRIENATRNKIQQAARFGSIIVNGCSVKPNYRVKPDDKISVMLSYPPHDDLLIPEEIKLDIVFEDEEILIINKPAGLVVHPGHGNYSGTLLNGILFYLDKLPKNRNNRPGLVHRIDKDTSGLLVIAKTETSMINLSNQFHDKISQRTYTALVWGDLKSESGTINEFIGRDRKNRMLMTVFPDKEFGKYAVTHYKVLERFGYVTLISCTLETGRTHQIRAHMKYIGHTLFNDVRYGGDKILKGTTFNKYKQFVENCFKTLPRQALHAKTLGFIHPKSNKKIYFNSDIPNDFLELIEKWRAYSKHQILLK